LTCKEIESSNAVWETSHDYECKVDEEKSKQIRDLAV
jgi:hypothetical protein